jgi:hypothetical protein
MHGDVAKISMKPANRRRDLEYEKIRRCHYNASRAPRAPSN